jgi:uncharacterized membrane protein
MAAYGFVGPNVAVTVSAPLSVNMQLVVPVHPVQLVKLLLAPGVSVSVIDVFRGKVAVHEPVVQLIPAGLLTTVP